MNCEICNLPMLKNTLTKHHLIPRQQRVKNNGVKIFGVANHTIKVHKFCHAMIHIFFDNGQLANELNTKEKLKSNKIVQRYIQFIRHSPTTYYINSAFALGETNKIRKKILEESEQNLSS